MKSVVWILSSPDTWRQTGETEEVNVVTIPRSEHLKEECLRAKEVELQKLKDFNSYEIVDDRGQFRISCTWVLTRKDNGDVRARLVARGFEEECSSQKDSPTIGRSTLRLFLAVVASQKWEIRSTDIKLSLIHISEPTRPY